MTTYLKGTREDVERDIADWSAKATSDSAVYDGTDIEFQTDKANVKVVPCVGCAKPLGVNVFYAPAIAKCSDCGGQAASARTGESQIVQAGRTDPAKAARLSDTLINKQFADAICPLCGEIMELKNVVHNALYGPRRSGSTKNDTGETVLLQCNSCKCCTSYSTTTQMVLRRQNEPKVSAGSAPHWPQLLGTREEEA